MGSLTDQVMRGGPDHGPPTQEQLDAALAKACRRCGLVNLRPAPAEGAYIERSGKVVPFTEADARGFIALAEIGENLDGQEIYLGRYPYAWGPAGTTVAVVPSWAHGYPCGYRLVADARKIL